MKTITREITAGGIASAGFLVVLFPFSFPLVVSMLVAGGLYGGAKLALPRDPEDHEITVSPGMTLEQAKKMLAEGYASADRFREVAKSINDADVRKIVMGTAEVITDLFKSFEEDPENLVTIHAFMTDHLGRAYEIIQNYARLSNKPHLDANTMQKMARVADMINKIHDAIKAQYLQIINNELTELDTAGKVFKSILEVEGAGSNEIDLSQ